MQNPEEASSGPTPEIILPSRGVAEAGNKGQAGGGHDERIRMLSIGQLHLYGNDIAELRKLAEVDPELARKVVDQRDNEDTRANISYRFGLGSTVVLICFVLASFSYLLVHFGITSTLIVVACILATAVLIRVILTGQWSDTTWFGKLISFGAKVLGSSDEPKA